jgi:hypothetical protein
MKRSHEAFKKNKMRIILRGLLQYDHSMSGMGASI